MSMALKEKVLIELENHPNTFFSGQDLANQFHVSRNAIWKVVQSLKKEQYPIISSKNGYCINEEYDNLSSNLIKQHLTQPNLDIFIYDEVDSTNNEAKKQLSLYNQSSSFLVLAKKQVGGRGRQGKSFYSPKDNGIYMSFVFSPHQSFDNIVNITCYAALCVQKAIEKIYHQTCQIKWVNDVFYQEKKICGILTEAISDFESSTVQHVIIGIGINLYPNEVPKNLKDVIGFLNCKKGYKNQLIAEIINELTLFEKNKLHFIEEYKKHSFVLNQEITYTYNNQTYKGKVLDIDTKGALIIQNEKNKIDILSSGEISITVKKTK